jgi:hypothetical protein
MLIVNLTYTNHPKLHKPLLDKDIMDFCKSQHEVAKLAVLADSILVTGQLLVRDSFARLVHNQLIPSADIEFQFEGILDTCNVVRGI